MNIAAWLVDTITIQAPAGTNNYGDPTYSAQTTKKARVEEVDEILRRIDGSEHQVDHRLAMNERLGIDTRVWLPGADTGDTGASKRVLRIKTAKTKSGSYQFWIMDLGD